jgi:hypothetical protein
MSREAMQIALDALESDPTSLAWLINKKQAITALRQALVDADDTSQKRVDEMVKTEHDRAVELGKAYERGWNAALAQQEPVAWISEGGDVSRSKRYMDEMGFKCNPLYTAPPKREWVGLTDEDISYFRYQATFCDEFDAAFMAELIEKNLKEKNHG